VQLNCGHVFHKDCIVQLLKSKWHTLKINFGFMACPACKAPIDSIDCEEAQEEVTKLMELKNKVEKEAVQVAERQGLIDDERLVTPEDHYFLQPLEFAMHKTAFYQCGKCEDPFFGGLVDCAGQAQENDVEKESLRCQTCRLEDLGAGSKKCDKHSHEHIIYKCNYCCSEALFNCGPDMYMCHPCHEEFMDKCWRRSAMRGQKMELKCCIGTGKRCPLGCKHPPANEDVHKSVFAIGCGLCRAEKLEELSKEGGIQEEFTQEVYVPKRYPGPPPEVLEQERKEREEQEKRWEEERKERERVREERRILLAKKEAARKLLEEIKEFEKTNEDNGFGLCEMFAEESVEIRATQEDYKFEW